MTRRGALTSTACAAFRRRTSSGTEQKSEGSHAELGIAIALKRRIVASGPGLLTLSRVFHRFADLATESHGSMLEILAKYPPAVIDMAPRPRARLMADLPRP